MKSLFNKKIPASCSWCIHSNKSLFTDDIFCIKHGVLNKHDACRKYKYDPLKRTPKKIKPSDGYSPDDFKL